VAEKMKQERDKAVQIGTLDKEMGEDPVGTYARLGDPQKYYSGVDPEVIRIKRNQALGAVHQLQEKEETQLYTDYTQKKITPLELKQQADMGLARGTISRSMHMLFSNIYDCGMAGITPKTDYDVYWPMYQAAKNQNLDMQKAIAARGIGKLTDGDVHTLIRLHEGKAPQSFFKVSLLKKHYDMNIADIKARFKPVEGLMSIYALKSKDMGPLPSNEAASLFTQECEVADAKGELTAEWMRTKKEEIVKVYMEDALIRTKSMKGGKPMGAPAPSPRPGGKPPLFNPTAGPKGSQQKGW